MAKTKGGICGKEKLGGGEKEARKGALSAPVETGKDKPECPGAGGESEWEGTSVRVRSKQSAPKSR